MSVRRKSSKGVKLGLFSAVLTAALTALVQSPLADQPEFVNTGPYSLVGAIRPFLGDTITSFDISFVDPVRKRYFLANRTAKDIIVVDTATNLLVGNFKPGFAGAVGT